MNKPYSQARRLGDLVGRCLSKTLARQGFASTELVTRYFGDAKAQGRVSP